MELDKKAGIPVVIGLLVLAGIVASQTLDSTDNPTEESVVKDENIDLVLPNTSFQFVTSSQGNLNFDALYVNRTDKPGNSTHKGVFIVRLNNTLSREYTNISSSSYVQASVINGHIHHLELDRSNYCRGLEIAVVQDGEVLETVNVGEDEEYKEVSVKARPASNTTIGLELVRNSDCAPVAHIIAVDKFYLEERRPEALGKQSQ